LTTRLAESVEGLNNSLA